MWTSLRNDWNGFLSFVQKSFPDFRPNEAPSHSDGWPALKAHLSRVSDLTRAEVEEIVEALVLPRWVSRRDATAAA
ncbi:MAG: hypothetical protein KJO42_17110 [Silicimonas sp.]|nr:hypothetical protein [Silicimonas sp.]